MNRRPAHRAPLRPSPGALLLVLGSWLAAAPACQPDECPEGVRRCTDNVAESCVGRVDNELSSHTEWFRQGCGDGFCQLPPPGDLSWAFCALDESPDPACPAALQGHEQTSRCVGNTAVTWRFAYRIDERPCGAETCIDATHPGVAAGCEDAAFCSPSGERDPRCQPGIVTFCADAQTIVYCSCGFATDPHACQSPGPSCVLEEVVPDAPLQGVCR